jgi:hypothetical protein
MLSLALLIIGQGTENTAEAPDDGVGLGIIIGVIAAIVIAFSLILLVFHNRAKASKGGVEPPPSETGEPHPGSPPVESVEPRS